MLIDEDFPARVHIELMDKNDGSFIVRYRLHAFYKHGLRISITYKNKHVAQSPYILKGIF